MSKILITGGTGLVGSAFNRIETHHELVLLGSKDYNLLSRFDSNRMILNHKPDVIIHLAAKVGGVKGNMSYMSDFFSANIQINNNVLMSAQENKVPKVLSLLSTCVYPDKVNYPLTEDQIHSGPPHKSNYGYAYAKRMLDIQSRSIRDQYGLKYITAIPNNIYGKNDNFDLENGHVIPAIVRKIYEASHFKSKSYPVFWGSGNPIREFTYADDIAKALLFLVDNYNDPEPVNIGNTNQNSIKSIVQKVAKIFNYDGVIKWDKTKPEGQFKKPSCNEKFLSMCPDFKYTNIDKGLKKTCNWLDKNYKKARCT